MLFRSGDHLVHRLGRQEPGLLRATRRGIGKRRKGRGWGIGQGNISISCNRLHGFFLPQTARLHLHRQFSAHTCTACQSRPHRSMPRASSRSSAAEKMDWREPERGCHTSAALRHGLRVASADWPSCDMRTSLSCLSGTSLFPTCGGAVTRQLVRLCLTRQSTCGGAVTRQLVRSAREANACQHER